MNRMKVRFTGETKHAMHPDTLNQVLMHRVEYVVSDVRVLLGGWVESLDSLQEGGRVLGEAKVFRGSVLTGSSRIFDNAQVYGNSVISGTSSVVGKSYIDNSTISGNSFITESNVEHSTLDDVSVDAPSRIVNSVVTGKVSLRIRVSGEFINDCYISRQDHILKLSNFGSESMDVHLTRRKDGVPWVKVGCWEGPLSRLMDKVYDRQENDWEDHTSARSDNWLEQYKALDTLLRLRVDSWDL